MTKVKLSLTPATLDVPCTYIAERTREHTVPVGSVPGKAVLRATSPPSPCRLRTRRCWWLDPVRVTRESLR